MIAQNEYYLYPRRSHNWFADRLEIDLKPGAALFMYTDGLTEATDPDNKLFGMDHALEELNRDTGRMAEDYIKQMKEAVKEFEKGREPFDDLTMLCVIYWGPEGPPYWNK